MTGRRGLGNIFSDEDIELMLTIRREAEERAEKAAQRAARPKRATKPRAAEPAPDRRTVAKKKRIGDNGPGPSSKA